MIDKIKSYIQLVRMHQWVKNLFVFVPLFFSFKFTDLSLVMAAIWAFFGFCFIASSIYVINDWCDIASDRLHPEKKDRPLACGAISTKEAFVLLLFFLLASVGIFVFVLDNIAAAYLIGAYFVLNLLYSFKLKHIAIVDIAIVAAGFVIRIFVGGFVTDTPLSRWLVIMTFLLAILIALGKRRDDVIIFEHTGDKMRKNIDGYNLSFINAGIIIISSIVLVAYIMYTMSPEVTLRNGDNLYLTSIFVIIGLLRYLQIIFVEEKSGNPTKIFLKDHFIHLVIIGWIGSFLIISLYFN